jgi:hypothetical protein
MRHHQFLGRQSIERQQQPAAELLLDRVVPVARRSLGHLGHQRLRVAEQQALQQFAALEFLLQQAAAQAVRMTGRLHHRRTGRGVAAHEQRNADHPFVADSGGFGRSARRHDVVQRNDRRGREIGVGQLPAGFVEHVAEQHRHEFQVRRQTFELGCRQRREKMVLARTRVGRHGGRLAADASSLGSLRRRFPGNR